MTRLLATLSLLVAAVALTASPALARKRDHDRLPDRWEKRHHLNLKKNDAGRDRDRDGLTNYGEYRAHTNPRKKDSDRDGRRDAREDYDRDRLKNAVEIKTGYDPGDADSDNDGVKDGRENAGTITKLSDSSITIALAAGGSLTAALGEDLVVKCKPGHSGSGSKPKPDGGDAPDEGEASEDVDEPVEDEPAEDEPSVEEDEDSDDVVAVAATNDEEVDELDEGAFDQAFDDESGHKDKHCGPAALKVGAVVHKAKFELTDAGLVLVSVKLVR